MAKNTAPGARGNSRFAQIPQANIARSAFDRSHGHKTTLDSGFLVPVFVDEALPGDTFTCEMNHFARMATPLFPVMDNFFLDTFFFAVPMRLVWDNFVKFMGEQTDPGDSTDFLVPTITSPPSVGHSTDSLDDYLGIPPGVPDLEHSSLWHRAYNLIWNEWFRDENLQDSVQVDKDDGPDSTLDYVLLRRGKRHDYFTSCLPFTQKGTAVGLPLGTSAPVQGVGGNPDPGAPIKFGFIGNTREALLEAGGSSSTFAAQFGSTTGSGQTAGDNAYWIDSALEADLSSATAATINEIREAFQIQRLLERDARGGTRYTEVVRSHFGVMSPDERLQRPEYLGGGSFPIQTNPVATTYDSGTDAPVGSLAAFTTSAGAGRAWTRSFTEHCLIIGMVAIRADLTYQQGLHKMFSRSTRYDFFWPALAHLGEQAVLNKEIFAQGIAADDTAFGYQERYAEYRYKPSTLSGTFRSDHPQSLDAWHLAQDFSALPLLNDSFIQDTPPFSRVVATPSEPEFLLDCYYRLKCVRPMPTYGVPGLIDHF